jgi:hypothetical protein
MIPHTVINCELIGETAAGICRNNVVGAIRVFHHGRRRSKLLRKHIRRFAVRYYAAWKHDDKLAPEYYRGMTVRTANFTPPMCLCKESPPHIHIEDLITAVVADNFGGESWVIPGLTEHLARELRIMAGAGKNYEFVAAIVDPHV